MRKLLLGGLMLLGGLAVQAQPPVSLYNTFIFHNNGTSEGIQYCTLRDSYTGFNISVSFPAPFLAAGASYTKVSWGSAWPVYQGDTISFVGGANNCAWLDGSAVTSVQFSSGTTYTLPGTSAGSPVTIDVYMWGGAAAAPGRRFRPIPCFASRSTILPAWATPMGLPTWTTAFC